MTRLLTPSEVELWELAKKAAMPPHNCRWAIDCKSCADERKFSGVSPLTISALLETLEKTREALRDAAVEAHGYGLYRDHRYPDVTFENCEDSGCRNARSLLSGFSGEGER